MVSGVGMVVVPACWENFRRVMVHLCQRGRGTCILKNSILYIVWDGSHVSFGPPWFKWMQPCGKLSDDQKTLKIGLDSLDSNEMNHEHQG